MFIFLLDTMACCFSDSRDRILECRKKDKMSQKNWYYEVDTIITLCNLQTATLFLSNVTTRIESFSTCKVLLGILSPSARILGNNHDDTRGFRLGKGLKSVSTCNFVNNSIIRFVVCKLKLKLYPFRLSCLRWVNLHHKEKVR